MFWSYLDLSCVVLLWFCTLVGRLSVLTGTAVHRLYRTGLLCLGVMCIIQATLNVVLRILSSVAQDNSTDQTNKEDQVQNFFKNLTAEKDQLETIYKQLQRERDQLQTRYEQLRRERDQSNAQMRTCEENFQRLKASTCPSGWVTIGSSIYYVSMTTNTWSLSRKDCEERGADLVVINSREEQDFIRGLAVHVWIGLMETDSVWTWVDGTSLSTRYWLEGEPNEYRSGEDCVHSKPSPDSRYSWNDEQCHTYLNWVCERQAC